MVVINNAEPDKTRAWAAEVGAEFPVLAQEKFSISKRYQAFATPFAFLIDEQGIIRSKGLVGSRQHLGYVLSGAGKEAEMLHSESPTESANQEESETSENHSISTKEVDHV